MRVFLLSVSLCLVFAVLAGSARAEDSAPASARSAYIGPDVHKDGPVLIDSIGEHETLFRAWGHPGTAAKASRWSAKLEFFVKMKDAADDDVVVIQLKKGKKKLGKPTPCNPNALYPEVDLAYFECDAPKEKDHAVLFSTQGEHTVELTYRKTIEGKDYKNFAVLKVYPAELKKGSANKPTPAWGTNHDMKLTVSTIEEKVYNGGNGTRGKIANALAANQRKGIPYMLVHTWFKREKRFESTKMTCLFDGKRIAEANGVGNHSFDSWSFVKRGSPKRDDAKWKQAEYFLHSLHPRPGPNDDKGSWAVPQHWMNENPGEYKCVITGDGEILKELYFSVGADGEIVKPDCQLKSMNSLATVTMLGTKDKKPVSDRKWDKQLGKKLGYEGRVKWAKGCPVTK